MYNKNVVIKKNCIFIGDERMRTNEADTEILQPTGLHCHCQWPLIDKCR